MADRKKTTGKAQGESKALRRKLAGKSAASAAGILAAAAVLNDATSATNSIGRASVRAAAADKSLPGGDADSTQRVQTLHDRDAGFAEKSSDLPASSDEVVQAGDEISPVQVDAVQDGVVARTDSTADSSAVADTSQEGDPPSIETADNGANGSSAPMQLAQAQTTPANGATEAQSTAGNSGTAGTASGAAEAEASQTGVGAELDALPPTGAGIVPGIGIGPLLGGGGLAAAAAGAGGGGGGGSSSLAAAVSTVAKTVVKGTVIDGPVKKATIFYDENNDGKLNANEKSTVTNDDGSYTLEGYTKTAVGKFVVLPGGVDIFSGKAVGILTAVEGADGSTVITPLTTLLANTSLTQAELKTALGLTGLSVNLETFDPYAAMKSTDPAVRAIGEKVFTAGQQIMTIMQASVQQSVSAGGTGSDTAAQYKALNAVAAAVSVAVHTVDNLPSSDVSGGGLMKTIATFAIAAGNGVDVAQYNDNPNALSLINTALSGKTTALSIIGAVDSINQNIATAFTDLASKIASGGSTLADAQAVTALSQSLLGTSIDTLITTGASSGLELLSSATGLAGLIDTVSTEIENGATDAVLPQIITATFSEALSHVTNNTPYATGDAVLVKVADADLSSLVTNAAGFHNINVDLLDTLDSSMVLTEAQATSLVSAGLSFADDNTVNVQAQGTQLSTSLKELQKLGVDNVLVDSVAAAGAGHDIALALGTSGTLLADSIPKFDSSYDVKLNITDSQIKEVADLAVNLQKAGVDVIGADDGTLTVTDSNLHSILDSGLAFAPESVVTGQVSDAGLTTLVTDINTAATHSIATGVDFIDMADDSALITETQASSLIAAGVAFSASDTVSVQAEGTRLSTSLKDLQKLGVDTVLIDGTAAAAEPGHDLALVLGSGTLSDVGIPHFDTAATVRLGIADGQVTEIATHATPLHDAGIDFIAGIDGSLTVAGTDLHSIVSSGLVFASGTEVTAAVSDAALTTLINDVTSHSANLGVDIVDMTDNTASITEAQAVSLIHAGVEFAAADTVDMQATGTHVSTSLKDLHDLGVDHVTVDAVAAGANPGHDLVLALGDVATGADPAAELLAFLETYAGHPLFTSSADVAIEISPTVFAAVDGASTLVHDAIVADLINLGVDEVKVIGTDTEHDLHTI